jgi:uncharacterized protein
MPRDYAEEDGNKVLVQASFDRWKNGTGGPFELLAPDAEWTIVGSSPLSKTYRSKKEFLDSVINPFNARMSTPLVPTIRGIYADGDTVIILFDAAATVRDGKPYHNTYAWYFQMRDAQVVKAIAFFDRWLQRIEANLAKSVGAVVAPGFVYVASRRAKRVARLLLAGGNGGGYFARLAVRCRLARHRFLDRRAPGGYAHVHEPGSDPFH